MGNEIFDSFTQKPTTFAPMIYAYSDIAYPGCLKVGYTSVDIDKRVAQQYPTKRPDGKVPYEIVGRREGDIEQVWANPLLAQKVLKWKAKATVEETLVSAWKWQQHCMDRK